MLLVQEDSNHLCEYDSSAHIGHTSSRFLSRDSLAVSPRLITECLLLGDPS